MEIARLLPDARGWTYRELRATASRSRIDEAVERGALVRLRRGFYVRPTVAPTILEAARLHARLDCVSLLAHLGVFVLETRALHVQFETGTTATPSTGPAVVRHWRTTAVAHHRLTADLIGALAQACRCQSEAAALATLDSAWHHGFIDGASLSEVFALLPRRFARFRRELERRSESGPETILRIALRRRGWHVEVQIRIDGVGRVDLVVDEWLIVECDSEKHHSGWAKQKEDRRRDQAAAAQGYTTIRPLAEDIMWHTEQVLAAIEGLLAARARAAMHNLSRVRSIVRL